MYVSKRKGEIVGLQKVHKPWHGIPLNNLRSGWFTYHKTHSAHRIEEKGCHGSWEHRSTRSSWSHTPSLVLVWYCGDSRERWSQGVSHPIDRKSVGTNDSIYSFEEYNEPFMHFFANLPQTKKVHTFNGWTYFNAYLCSHKRLLNST